MLLNFSENILVLNSFLFCLISLLFGKGAVVEFWVETFSLEPKV